VFSLVLAVVTLVPRSASAVQTHGGAEGLVAHELGHVLFAAGLLYIVLAGGTARWARAGRNCFRGFLILAIAWNLLTFTGHLLQVVLATDGSGRFFARGAWDYVYYATCLDHLLLVPGMALLLVALLRWWRSEEMPS